MRALYHGNYIILASKYIAAGLRANVLYIGKVVQTVHEVHQELVEAHLVRHLRALEEGSEWSHLKIAEWASAVMEATSALTMSAPY